jgi:hypothetical protein
MSSDTHRLCRCGRKQRASMPLSRHAWLAEDSSRLCRRRRRAALHAHRGDTNVLSALSRKDVTAKVGTGAEQTRCGKQTSTGALGNSSHEVSGKSLAAACSL